MAQAALNLGSYDMFVGAANAASTKAAIQAGSFSLSCRSLPQRFQASLDLPPETAFPRGRCVVSLLHVEHG